MSLVDAVYDDVADSILLEQTWKKHKSGMKLSRIIGTSIFYLSVVPGKVLSFWRVTSKPFSPGRGYCAFR